MVQLRQRVTRALGDPMLRNGHMLTIGAGATGVLGFLYWSLAARHYSAVAVGEGSSAVSALMLIGGLANLNFMSLLMRFVPTQGPGARRLVVGTYAAGVVTAAGLSTLFVYVAGAISPELAFFHSSTGATVTFIASSMLWTISVLQDAALTGTRKPGWVAIENIVMAIVKVVFVVALAVAMPHGGILMSWTVGLVVAALVANGYLFGRALPRHRLRPRTESLTAGDLVRFAGPDYLSSVVWLGAIAALPLIVVAQVGAGEYAYFAVAWSITFMLYQSCGNLGYSLTVEGAANQAAIPMLWMRLMRHIGPLLLVGVAVIVAGAPLFLRPFGAAYSTHASTILRILILSAIPHLVTTSAVSVARTRRRTDVALGILGVSSVTVIGLSLALLPSLGVTGVAVAWLVGETTAAVGALAFRHHWLTNRAAKDADRRRPNHWRARRPLDVPVAATSGSEDGLEALMRPAAAGLLALGDHVAADPGPLSLRPLQTVNDVTVVAIVSPEGPVGVLKRPAGPVATKQVRAEHDALDRLRRDPRIDGWRATVPASCWVEHPGGVFAVQAWLPGVRGLDRMYERPTEAARLVSSGLHAIRDVHERTASTTKLTESLTSAWIDAPLELVGRLGRRAAVRPPNGQLDGLRDALNRGLVGADAPLGWVHGDLWLGSILYDQSSQVCGFVDWNQAGESLVDLDACSLALTTWAGLTGRSLGSVTVSCLRAGGWTSLAAGHLGVERSVLAHRSSIDEPTVLLLTWLRHVSMNLTKAVELHENPVWLRSNVVRVLQAL